MIKMIYSVQVLHGMIYSIISSADQEPSERSEAIEHATDAIIELIKQDRQAREAT